MLVLARSWGRSPTAAALAALAYGFGAPVLFQYCNVIYLVGAAWQSNSYTYTAATVGAAGAQMTTPAPGSTLTAATVQFQWTGGTGVSQYSLDAGTTPGGTELWSQNEGTNLTVTVSGLPTTGAMIYVRLGSLMGAVWQYNSYTYTAATFTSALAQMTTPAPGSTHTASTAQYQ
jgi:hypothetical protein